MSTLQNLATISFFILSLNAFADKGYYFREGAIRCGYDVPNYALFRKKLIKENDTEKLNCIASKKKEIKALDRKLRKNRETRKAKLKAIESYDCNRIGSEFLKLMCEERKVR